MEKFAVVLVQSTNQAMRIEHLLHLSGITSQLMPIPKFLSSNCGNCLRIQLDDIEKVKTVIDENKIIIEGIEVIAY